MTDADLAEIERWLSGEPSDFLIVRDWVRALVAELRRLRKGLRGMNESADILDEKLADSEAERDAAFQRLRGLPNDAPNVEAFVARLMENVTHIEEVLQVCLQREQDALAEAASLRAALSALERLCRAVPASAEYHAAWAALPDSVRAALDRNV